MAAQHLAGTGNVPSSVGNSESITVNLPEPGGTDSSENRQQVALVTGALSDLLRPVVRRCDLVLGERRLDSPVRVSSLTSEQRRALASVEQSICAPLPIERDFIKIEAEEMELAPQVLDVIDSETGASYGVIDSGGGAGGDWRADGGGGVVHELPLYDCGDDSPDYHPSMTRSPPGRQGGRRRYTRRRALAKGVPLARAGGTGGVGGGGRGRSGAKSSQWMARPRARGGGGAGGERSARSGSGAIPILTIGDRKITVELLRGRLAIRGLYDISSRPVELSEHELTFMELVQVKDNIGRLLAKLSGATGAASCSPDQLQRVRAARSLALGWVEARLRADPQLRATATAGAAPQQQAQPAAAAPAPGRAGVSGTELAQADGGVFESQTPAAATENHACPDQSAGRSLKNDQDLATLHTKLRDLLALESELRRAVDFFGAECAKDAARLRRMSGELAALRAKRHSRDQHLAQHRHRVAYILLDKSRRRQLSADDGAVQACADLLTEVGHELYVHLLSLPLPLLTPKELQERSRGKSTPWLDRRLLRAASRSVKQYKRAISDAPAAAAAADITSVASLSHHHQHHHQQQQQQQQQQQCQLLVTDHQHHVTVTDEDQVDTGVAEHVSSFIDGADDVADHITLPPDVLEQVMQGKGYLVDENGDRLEIRVLPDGNVIAGTQTLA